MKKLFFMAVAAIAALSSCTSDNELELNQNTGKEALTFTATMEDSEATRATYDNTNQYALWEAGDQISINGKSYTAQEGAGAKATFKADGEGAEGTTYEAYFPADLYDGTLPAIQTYTAGKFNMPMYAKSETTTLAFKNLCAVLAIKVTSADIEKLKSIKVASDKKMNGTFTVTDKKAVMGTDGTNAVVLESSEALTLDETGTTFYIAIPAQTYQYLNIFLSADGETYTQAMATKKKDGLGTIARSKIFNIDYAKNATKLWEGNLFFADCNVGATAENIYGGLYTWGGTQDARVSYTDDHNQDEGNLSGTDDTATKLWGSNWRMPTREELTTLKGFGSWISNGLLCESPDYAGNTVFLPAAGYCNCGDVYNQNEQGLYWSSTPISSNYAYQLSFTSGSKLMSYNKRSYGCPVRAVLEEAASPAPAAPATTGKAKATIGGSEVDVNWVQLWAGGPKFAEYNVGVTDGKAESYGGYYCWGSSIDKDSNAASKSGNGALIGTDDTATNLWGSEWRMPTKAELDGLLANCDVAWTTVNDVNGRKFTGNGDYASNSVFLPDAGYCGCGDVDGQGGYGSYWSSTPNGSSLAYFLHFESGFQSVGDDDRRNGYSVRAVLAE